MNALILSIGTELTTGQCLDTNAAWIAAELTRRGVRVVGHLTVDDEIGHLQAAFHRAMEAADLVVATGGLGPTTDDLTRDALAQAIGQPLTENAEALEQVRAFFARWDRPMHPANAVQTMIPRGCRVIRNDRGTAPGIWYYSERVSLFALPGVPSEMKAMFTAVVTPHVEAVCGKARTKELRLPCFGISEARVGELLGELMSRDRNPLVGTTASRGVIAVRILAAGNSEAEADRMIEADAAEIRRRLGKVVFGQGDESLEGVVGRLLRERGQTLSTAESCTGGLLAKRLTDVPGSSDYFVRGHVTYSNASKTELPGVSAELIEAHGAVSEGVAGAMASGCRTVSGSEYAIGITGIAGPGGGCPPEKPVGLVYVALAGPADTDIVIKRLLIGEHLAREEIRDRAASVGLNLLRLRMFDIETP